ncbi:MAG TPA: DUF1015 domain-containing protein [Actinomycetota bacterium]|nr:DUF1015 domain-containing protein [Actinomycetota bacterium]
MPELRPFHGIRYSSSSDLAKLICPPYDIISPDEQAGLHALHPHNAVHLELAQGGRSSYDAAGETFREWLADGTLARDPQPSLYVYRQDFVDAAGTRRRVVGVTGALALEPFGDSAGVLPHERTMAGPKEDRLALMRAVRANVSPIYAVYRGAGGLGPFYDSLENRPTAGRAQDGHGILHRLWVISAPGEVAMLQDAIAPGPLVIADGHHRYETALAYHAERQGEPRPIGSAIGQGKNDHDSIMCFCVDADSEELVVLPYNRVLRADVTSDELAGRLRENLGAEQLTGDPQEFLASSKADHAFAFVLDGARLGVEVSDAQVVDAVGDRAAAWRALDVVALHEVVLPAVLPGGSAELAFTKEPAEIDRRVAEGWTAGVLLRALRPADVVEVATSGERMPQKASYFWPKAATGLVFHELG